MTLDFSTNDYFNLFGLPRDYNIDLESLEQKFFILQKDNHPDKFINASTEERQSLLSNSALINNAYKILKTPLLRAEHLLTLANIDINRLEAPAFLLMQSLEWRETLEASSTSEALNRLLKEVSEIEKSNYSQIQEYFTKKLYNEASTVYIELKFILRFKQEIIEKLDSLDEII